MGNGEGKRNDYTAARANSHDAARRLKGRTTVNRPIVVAIVNTNPDLVRILRIKLEYAGFVVLVLHVDEMKQGEEDLDSILKQHDPKVIVYDVAPPYRWNWRFLDHLRTSTGFKGRRFVLTTLNKKRLEEIVGLDETVYEILGEEDDMDAVVQAVKEASRARPTR